MQLATSARFDATAFAEFLRTQRDLGTSKAVDTDDGWCQPLPDGRQMWREDAIQALLATEDADLLFVAGCEENQVQLHAQFDHITLLSAPPQTLVERLAARTDNPYGKAPANSAASLMTSGPWSPRCGE